MSRTVITGIDPGDQAVKVVVLKVEADTPRILALAKREARGFRHGYIINQEEAEESIALAIKDAEKASGERIRRAVIGAGSVSLAAQQVDGLAMVARADAEITDLDVKRALEAAENKVSDLANRRVLDTIPISFKLDSRKVLGTPRGMRGAKLEARALFVSALSQHMDDLESAVHGAGIKIEDIIPGAVAASFVTLSEVEKAAGCILAIIGSDTVSTAVFEEGMLVSLQVFPIGSRDITHDIALGLRIPIAEAEDIKINREYASFNKKKLDEIIEARLSDIFELIDNHLKKLGRSELLPAGIILTGGGALLPGIEASARGLLRLPSRVALPLFPYQFRLKQENLISRLAIKDSSFATAYGLAIAGLFPSHQSSSPAFTNSTWNDFQGKAKDWFSQFLP